MTLPELRKKLKALKAEADAIFAKAEQEKRSLTEDEKKRDDDIEAEMAAIQGDITRAERHAQRERTMNAVASATAEDLEASAEAAKAKNKDPKKFGSMGEFLQAVATAEISKGRITDPRLLEAAASGANTTVPADGGFLVQTDFSTRLLEAGMQASVLAPECMEHECGENSDSVEMPYIDETSRATGSRFGGVRVYRASEAESVAASKPKFANLSLKIEDLKGLCYVTDRILKDAVQLQSIINVAFPSEFAFTLDDEIIRGSGAGQCLGILNAPCLVTQAAESGQAVDTVLFENVSKMRNRLLAKYWTGAAFYINQDVMPQLEQMKLIVGTGGVPVYLPASGISQDGFDRLYGRPVIPLEQCSALGDVGDIVLANFGAYMLAKKGTLEMASSMHVKFVEDEMAFRFKYRINGTPICRSAITPYKGTTTRSPFVALAAR